jgi:hypothetical protein
MLLFDFLQRLQGNRFVPKADIAIVLMNVCFVPKADIAIVLMNVRFTRRVQPIDATPSNLARGGGVRWEGTARIWFTRQQRAELWERWKNGQCVADIARALERRNQSGVYRILALNGGIAPEPRRRAAGALRLEERCSQGRIMRSTLRGVTAGIVLSVALMFLATVASAGSKEDVAVVTLKWAQALGEDDPDKILSFYSDDAVLWGTLSPTVRADRAALRGSAGP